MLEVAAILGLFFAANLALGLAVVIAGAGSAVIVGAKAGRPNT